MTASKTSQGPVHQHMHTNTCTPTHGPANQHMHLHSTCSPHMLSTCSPLKPQVPARTSTILKSYAFLCLSVSLSLSVCLCGRQRAGGALGETLGESEQAGIEMTRQQTATEMTPHKSSRTTSAVARGLPAGFTRSKAAKASSAPLEPSEDIEVCV
jgi:hypothetical protein